MLDKIFIIPLLPLFAFVMIVFFTRWKELLSAWLSILMVAIGWVLSIIVMVQTLGVQHGAHVAHVERAIDIVNYPNFHLEMGTILDPLTAVMLIVVTTVSFIVQVY
jgi:NADH-quinone oxidoreductase subunit L